MCAWNSTAIQKAPVGAGSLLAVVILGVCCLAFHVAQSYFVGGWVAAFIILAYFLFPVAVACTLYSPLFENRRVLGLAALALAALTFVLLRDSLILLDGVLLLPFWFLTTMGIVKFFRWKREKSPAKAPD